MLAVDPPVKILVDALEPKGPSTHTLSRFGDRNWAASRGIFSFKTN